jgi:hypothetical protein
MSSFLDGAFFALGMILMVILFIMVVAFLIFWGLKTGKIQHLAIGTLKNAIGL